MFHFTRNITALGVAATLGLAQPVLAQETPDLDTVVATVGDTEITLGHMIALRATLPPQYDNLPANILFQGVRDQLIQQTLLMDAHNGDLPRGAQLMIENERRAIIASDVIETVMESALSEDEVQAAYDAQYTNAEQETEYKAAHILVETEEEANALIAELEGGADFGDLAKAHSTGPSGASGGDLGWFGAGVMVEEFFNAVAALEVGEVSKPVKSDFGWHLIKLGDTRVKDTPTLDDVRAELEQELRQAAFEDYVMKLEKGADVDRGDITAIDPEAINDTKLLEN